MAKRVMFWDKAYTRRELMRESRGFMIFIGAINLLIGLLLKSTLESISPSISPTVVVVLGASYIVVGLLPYYWLRFGFLCFWLVDLVYTNLALGHPRTSSMIFIGIGVVIAYKMVKYRGVIDPPETPRASTAQKVTVAG